MAKVFTDTTLIASGHDQTLSMNSREYRVVSRRPCSFLRFAISIDALHLGIIGLIRGLLLKQRIPASQIPSAFTLYSGCADPSFTQQKLLQIGADHHVRLSEAAGENSKKDTIRFIIELIREQQLPAHFQADEVPARVQRTRLI